MLKCDPSSLYDEIKAAEELRDSQLSNRPDMLDEYVGPGFSEDQANSDYQPENHAYDWLRAKVPGLVFDNPRVSVTSMRAGQHAEAAVALEYGLNRWIVQNKLRRPLIRACYDMAFGYGVLMTCQGPARGVDPRDIHAPRWPSVHRIAPNRFLFDPLCLSFDEARWAGHMISYDKDDLIEIAREQPEEGWNLKVLEAMAGEDVSAVFEKEFPNKARAPQRDQLFFYEVWVPEMQLEGEPGPEEGFHGTIYTVCLHQSDKGKTTSEWVRDPRPYYGPRWGPYAMFGAYIVPDSPFPLSPLVATRGQQLEVNAHAKAAQTSAADYKKHTVVDASLQSVIDALQNQPHNAIVPAEGLWDSKNQIASVEIGGVTAAQGQMLAMVRERMNRSAGMSEAERGNTRTGASATADAIADEASSTAMAFLKSQFADPTEQVLRTGAYFLACDERSKFPLGPEAAAELGVPDPWFQGGLAEGDSPQEFFDNLELVLDPFSMPHISNAMQQAQAQQLVELVYAVAPGMVGLPWVKHQELMDTVGDMTNRDLSQMFDWGQLAQVQQMAQQQAQMAAMGMGAGPGGPGGQAPMLPGMTGQPRQRPTLSRQLPGGNQGPQQKALPAGRGAGGGGGTGSGGVPFATRRPVQGQMSGAGRGAY